MAFHSSDNSTVNHHEYKYVVVTSSIHQPKDGLVLSHHIAYKVVNWTITLTTDWLLCSYAQHTSTHKLQRPHSSRWAVHVSVLLFGSKLCHSQWLPWASRLEETGNQFASRYVQLSITAVQTILNKQGKCFQKEASNPPRNQGQGGDEDTKTELLATAPLPCDPYHLQHTLTAICCFGLCSSDALKSKYELKATIKM